MNRPAANRSGAASGASSAGLAFATAAFVWWGVSPAFWKLLAAVPPSEQLAHRVVWSALLMGLFLAWRGRLAAMKALVSSPRTVVRMLLSTLLIAFNWTVYVWSVFSDQILQASLGYFINPLVSVVLGLVFLHERLSRAQIASVGLATVGVMVLTWQLGELPWVSLALALSFGLYGLLRKTAAAPPPEEGLTFEVWALTPPALAFLIWTHGAGNGSFGAGPAMLDWLLFLTGVVTAVPLVWFAHGAQRLPLATVGLLQYLAPSGQFLLAVLVYREPFAAAQMAAFVCIWAALAIFTVDARRRRPRPQRPSPVVAS